MANAASDIEATTTPTLQRVRALIAMLFDMFGDPSRFLEFQRICEEAEALLVRCIFEAACRFAGRSDLLATHEAYLVSSGRDFDIGVRERPDALHPHHRIILATRRARAVLRYRTALGRRRCCGKRSHLHFRNQRRAHGAINARRRAGCASPSHTPARISAPP